MDTPSRSRLDRWRTGRRPLVLTLLVAALATALAVLVPGVASAEGEQLVGTLQTSRSGPIEGVEVTVETADGQEVDSVETDEDGRFAIDLPGPGDYTISLDEEALPEGVELGTAGASRDVTVGPGRSQPVNFGASSSLREDAALPSDPGFYGAMDQVVYSRVITQQIFESLNELLASRGVSSPDLDEQRRLLVEQTFNLEGIRNAAPSGTGNHAFR